MRTLHAFTAAVFGCLLTAPVAFAASNGEDANLDLGSGETAKNAAANSASTGGSLVRTIVGLAVVLGVIYGLYWVLKQVKASREDKALGTGLKTLATLPLGPKGSMHLIRAGDEVVLVGVGEAGVTPIRTYGENEARALGLIAEDADEAAGDTILLPAETVEKVRPGFLASLRRMTVIK